jgi:RNA polymerase sigma factor (sigma-70 family)
MDNYEEYKDIYIYAKWVAENFWDMYKEYFCSGHQNLGEEDLVQEAYFEVFTKIPELIKKAKDKKHLKILVIQSVAWKMQKLLRREFPCIKVTFEKVKVSKARKDNIKLRESDKFTRNYYSKVPLQIEENNEQINHIDITKLIDPQSEKDIVGFKFEDIKKFLSDKEYKILYSMFYKKQSLRDIGKELKISRTWVCKIYEDAIKKLKKHFNN